MFLVRNALHRYHKNSTDFRIGKFNFKISFEDKKKNIYKGREISYRMSQKSWHFIGKFCFSPLTINL